MTPLPQSLDRTVVIRAPRDVVFRFFTDSERFARWWGPGSTIDARVGGEVRITYPNGVIARGTVQALRSDESITFSYGYEDPQKPIPVGGSVVTISRGVATAAPALDGTQNDLLQRADEKLYAAKRAGRNRTEC